jgi:hypothetical protein
MVFKQLTIRRNDVSKETVIPTRPYVSIKASKMELGAEPEACYSILKEYNLLWPLKFIEESNPSRDAPYHNAIHIGAVVSLCYEGGLFSHLAPYQMQILLTAAALHDYNHSAGEELDSANILEAVEGLWDMNERQARIIGPMTIAQIREAETAIRCTKYPFTREPKGDIECILRDADLMMPYLEPTRRLQLFKGLKQETKFEGSWVEFAGKVCEFYSNIKWHSIWGQKRSEVYHFERRVNDLCLDLEKEWDKERFNDDF